jgi:hypothetical protein
MDVVLFIIVYANGVGILTHLDTRQINKLPRTTSTTDIFRPTCTVSSKVLTTTRHSRSYKTKMYVYADVVDTVLPATHAHIKYKLGGYK